MTTDPFAVMRDASPWDLPHEDVNRLVPQLSGGSVAERVAAVRDAHGVADEA